ncbi:MAG: 2-amino-4-hydroxy-6-hydroxymethyldihydropteridine diphosphokinase [Planctomycetes bacterium]|nr:2-amino-4-hydroxy-6-hydroxymethyldihydropteridine diphosphokinase [Planctomycetota bacterium]
MARMYIALGANLGERAANLYNGVGGCAEHGLRLIKLAPIYESTPVGGPPGQPSYYNSVAEFESSLDPVVILRILQKIEERFGRVRTETNGPRTLDLDLLVYGSLAMRVSDLVLPHPRLHERLFVLAPFADIAAELIIPGIGKNVRLLRDERAALEPPDSVRRVAI